jgi:RNA polymerase sigma factor (sigma-70 family)
MTAPTAASADLRSADAFEAFYRRRWPQLLDFARFRLVGEGEAEDAAAESFSRAWAQRDRFDARRGPPEAWLFGIARHVVQDHRRRRRPTTALEPTTGAPDKALEALEDSLGWTGLRRALGELATVDQEIIALRFGAGLDHRSIAAALGQREGNVALRLHRSLRRLRQLLERSLP